MSKYNHNVGNKQERSLVPSANAGQCPLFPFEPQWVSAMGHDALDQECRVKRENKWSRKYNRSTFGHNDNQKRAVIPTWKPREWLRKVS